MDSLASLKNSSITTELINNLTKDIDKGNLLIDYFLTIGINEELMFNDWLYNTNFEELRQSNRITASIINKFPPIDKTSINIDENIIQHCFINGFTIVKSSSEPSKKNFSFVLDNSYYGILFPQKFITCIIFYERLDKYFKLHMKLKKLQKKYSTSKTFLSFKSNKKVEEIIGSIQENNYNQENQDDHHVNENEIEESKELISRLKSIYIPKCICLVSVHPFFNEFNKILNSLYSFSRKANKTNIPIEKVISNIVIEVPAPPRGLYKVEYSLFDEKSILTQPKMNDLPLVNYKFHLMFILLEINKIIEIFKFLLFEVRIVFFSSKIEFLAPIIQGFIQLLFPFKYSFQYITTLPEDNYIFLESISPFVVGINKSYSPSFFNDYKLEIEDIDILIVDLDKAAIKMKYKKEFDTLPDKQKQKDLKNEYPDLPEHYRLKLLTRIHELLKQFNNQSTKSQTEIDNFIYQVRDKFFQFNVNILQRYDEFLNNDFYRNTELGSPSITSLFHVNNFLKVKESNDHAFYNKLIKETQMFIDFLYKRMIPKDSREKLDIVLIDENLFKKHNRKFRILSKRKETPFLNTNAYDYKSTLKIVSAKVFNEKEKSEIFNDLSDEIKTSFLRKGQEIIIENENIYVKHHFFPILNNDFFFYKNIKDYYLPINLSDDIETINSEIASKSHLSNLKNLEFEMENNIYLCWMKLWAMTFWYHYEEDKLYWFDLLLKVIEKVYYHEIEVYNLIFDALEKYGNTIMILKLFERLINLRINPSYLICRIVIRLCDKEKFQFNKNSENIINYVKSNEYKLLPIFNDYADNKRIMYLGNNILCENPDHVYFNYIDYCTNCGEEININQLSRKFSLMKKEIEWGTCVGCGGSLLPKINISYGKDLKFNEEISSPYTSVNERIIIFSPSMLKHNYHVALIKEYQYKLDIYELKNKYSVFYWNSIWYFSILNLPYEFMFPYENKVFHMKSKGFDINLYALRESQINLVQQNQKQSLSLLKTIEENCLLRSSMMYMKRPSYNLSTMNLSVINQTSLEFETYRTVTNNIHKSKTAHMDFHVDHTNPQSNDEIDIKIVESDEKSQGNNEENEDNQLKNDLKMKENDEIDINKREDNNKFSDKRIIKETRFLSPAIKTRVLLHPRTSKVLKKVKFSDFNIISPYLDQDNQDYLDKQENNEKSINNNETIKNNSLSHLKRRVNKMSSSYSNHIITDNNDIDFTRKKSNFSELDDSNFDDKSPVYKHINLKNLSSFYKSDMKNGSIIHNKLDLDISIWGQQENVVKNDESVFDLKLGEEIESDINYEE